MAKDFGAELQNAALVRIQEANVTCVGGGHVLIVAKAELMEGGEGAGEGGESAAKRVKTEEGTAADAAPKEEPAAKTPAAALKSSAALAKSSPYTATTPANHPTPPSAGWCAAAVPARICLLCACSGSGLCRRPAAAHHAAAALRVRRRANKVAGGSASKRPVQPISALNPYNNNWAVKAKVINKGPLRRCAPCVGVELRRSCRQCAASWPSLHPGLRQAVPHMRLMSALACSPITATRAATCLAPRSWTSRWLEFWCLFQGAAGRADLLAAAHFRCQIV